MPFFAPPHPTRGTGRALRQGRSRPPRAGRVSHTPRCTRSQTPTKTRLFFSHFNLKMMILPRQARDKHRENSKKDLFSVCKFPVYICPVPVLAKRPFSVPKQTAHIKGVSRTAAVSEAPPFIRSTPHTLCTLIASPEKPAAVFFELPRCLSRACLCKKTAFRSNERLETTTGFAYKLGRRPWCSRRPRRRRPRIEMPEPLCTRSTRLRTRTSRQGSRNKTQQQQQQHQHHHHQQQQQQQSSATVSEVSPWGAEQSAA
jgi:hypothetical protein